MENNPTPTTSQSPIEQPTPVSQTPVTPAPTGKKGMPKVAKIVIGVVAGLIVLAIAGILIITTVVNNTTSGAVSVSDKFVNAVQANDPTTAYGLTSSAFKAATSEASLTSVIKSVSPSLSGSEKITGKAIKSTNGVNQAAVAYSVENNGKTRYIRVVLQEVNGQWQVINFRSSASRLEATIE